MQWYVSGFFQKIEAIVQGSQNNESIPNLSGSTWKSKHQAPVLLQSTHIARGAPSINPVSINM